MNNQDKTSGQGRGSNLTDADRSKGGQHSHQGAASKNQSTKSKPGKSSTR